MSKLNSGFKLSAFIIFLIVLVKSCIMPHNASKNKFVSASANSASEYTEADRFEESVAEIVKTYYSDFTRAVRIKFFTKGGDTIESYQVIRSMSNVTSAFLPEGGKYKMVYRPKRPPIRPRIFLNEPVYDSTQFFNQTKAIVTKENFIHFRLPIHYGGLQLIFTYTVDGKEYISHNGINLRETFPDIENPKKQLSFVGKKFVVEYDVDNPYIARILLDEEVRHID